MRKVCLLYGETGTGKTRLAHDLYGKKLYTVFDIKTPWFDGYDGHEAVLLDECGPGMMHWNMLKRITDRYAMPVPVKGGSVLWNPDVIILTSNCPLELWYAEVKGMNPMDYRAIARRIRMFKFPEERLRAEWYLRDIEEVVDAPTWSSEPLDLFSIE